MRILLRVVRYLVGYLDGAGQDLFDVVQPVRSLQVREPLGVLYHRETHVLHLHTTV